jgi:hypothetical protein
MAITIPVDGYCELTDVNSLAPQRTISSTTKPDDTQAEEMIRWWYAEINMMLARAGYITPMTNIATQLLAGGTIQVSEAVVVDDYLVELKDSTGVLAGRVIKGDLFLFSGDTMYYTVANTVDAVDNLVTVELVPKLRIALTVGLTAAHTPNLAAARHLKRLNALCVAAEAERATFSVATNEESESNIVFEDQKTDLWNAISSGRLTLIGAQRSRKVSPPGSARIERRG